MQWQSQQASEDSVLFFLMRLWSGQSDSSDADETVFNETVYLRIEGYRKG